MNRQLIDNYKLQLKHGIQLRLACTNTLPPGVTPLNRVLQRPVKNEIVETSYEDSEEILKHLYEPVNTNQDDSVQYDIPVQHAQQIDDSRIVAYPPEGSDKENQDPINQILPISSQETLDQAEVHDQDQELQVDEHISQTKKLSQEELDEIDQQAEQAMQSVEFVLDNVPMPAEVHDEFDFDESFQTAPTHITKKSTPYKHKPARKLSSILKAVQEVPSSPGTSSLIKKVVSFVEQDLK